MKYRTIKQNKKKMTRYKEARALTTGYSPLVTQAVSNCCYFKTQFRCLNFFLSSLATNGKD